MGGASEECVPLHYVCTQEAQSLLLYKCGDQQGEWKKKNVRLFHNNRTP
ncbi:MAG: hypothetical protein KIG52_09035 [Muribaculaceae bacterium]|nr:hypothetical protein [Muribaculaceae bacterium]